MSVDTDPRVAAVLSAVGGRLPPLLVQRLFDSLANLEQTEFGELEPLGPAGLVDW